MNRQSQWLFEVPFVSEVSEYCSKGIRSRAGKCMCRRCQREAPSPLNPNSGSNLGYEKQWLFEASFPSQSAHYSASTQENFMDAMAASQSSSPPFCSKDSSPPFCFRKMSTPIKGEEDEKEQNRILTEKSRIDAVGNLGHAYERLVRKHFRFRSGIPSPGLIPGSGLIPDVGTNLEITLEGSKGDFSRRKREQFKKYLRTPKGVLALFVPCLCKKAEDRLKEIRNEVQRERNQKEIKVFVYETDPDCKHCDPHSAEPDRRKKFITKP